VDAVVSYVDRAVDQLTGIVTSLGDELANQRPAVAGANSPYAILRHCLGVMEYWGGYVVAGRDVHRDRDAEFTAAGRAADLATAAEHAKRQFRADAQAADPHAAPRAPHPEMQPDDLELHTQGHALLHVMEELLQHLGHAELTRDVLLGRPPRT
jgi:hypothetical protein